MPRPPTVRRPHGRIVASVTTVLAILVAVLAVLMPSFVPDGAAAFGPISSSRAAPPTTRAPAAAPTVVPTSTERAADQSSQGTSPAEAH